MLITEYKVYWEILTFTQFMGLRILRVEILYRCDDYCFALTYLGDTYRVPLGSNNSRTFLINEIMIGLFRTCG